MNYKIHTIPRFDKDVKKLKKRFPLIKNDLSQLIQELKNNPTMGTVLSDNIYKIRWRCCINISNLLINNNFSKICKNYN